MHELHSIGKVYICTSTNVAFEIFYGFDYALKIAKISKDFFPKNYFIEFNAEEVVLSYYEPDTDLIYYLIFADFNQPSGKIVQTANFLKEGGNVINALSNYAYMKYHFPEVESDFEN